MIRFLLKCRNELIAHDKFQWSVNVTKEGHGSCLV